MRKILFSAIAIALMWSCSDDNSTYNGGDKDDSDLHTVEFSMSRFDNEVVSTPQPGTKIGQTQDVNVIKAYFFNIYDQAGKLKEQREMYNTTDSTIKFRFELPKGKYTGSIVAFNNSNGTVSKSSSNLLADAYMFRYLSDNVKYYSDEEYWNQQTHYFSNNYYSDYFYKNVAFSVDSSSKINVITPRVSGRVELYFKDIETIPNAKDTVLFARLKLEGMNYGVRLADGSAYSSTTSDYIYLTEKQWNQFVTRPLVINAMASISPKITIEYIERVSNNWWNSVNLDDDAVIKSVTCEIKGFQVYKNKITKLRGNAFLNTDFEIEIDTEWGGVIEGGW